MRAAAVIALGLAGCGAPDLDSGGAGTGTSTSPTDSTRSGDDLGAGVLSAPNDLGHQTTFPCDVYAQDCDPDEKCTWWANDGGPAFNATKCVPIADAPKKPGEACHAEDDGVIGIDDCETGSMCWGIDADGDGECIAFCVGSVGAALCEDPDQVCWQSGVGISLCVPGCDPLEPVCAEGLGCYPLADAFACGSDASGDVGAFGDPCESDNACDPGLTCIGAAAWPDCLIGIGCCSVFCDTEAAMDLCPRYGAGLQCTAWYPDAPSGAPPGLANVGVCLVAP